MRLLTSTDYAILEVLGEDGGFTTGHISKTAKFTYLGNAHMRSGAVRSWLMRLKDQGFVAPMDNLKPVCWVRTKFGTAQLARRSK